MEIAFIPSLRLRSTAIRFITLIGLTLIALTIGAAFLAADRFRSSSVKAPCTASCL